MMMNRHAGTNRSVNYPDIWGEGSIFAFSGWDGQTNASANFVATFGNLPYGLLIHTPRRRKLDIALASKGKAVVATGDAVVVETRDGELAYAFSCWHTIVGEIPLHANIELGWEDGKKVWQTEQLWITEDAEARDVVVFTRIAERFALSYGSTVEEACHRATKGLTLDAAAVINDRLSFYSQCPTVKDSDRDRLLKKCFSVMKTNTLSAEGPIGQMWSTPDRVPHRHMWLWDSVAHSFGMNLLSPRISWEFLQSVLETQEKDGRIPMSFTIDGVKHGVTQPPLLAWGVWENYVRFRNKEVLDYALPRLEKYLEWNWRNRDRNDNDLMEFQMDERGHSRSPESGMDNSIRFDRNVPLDAVDFSVFMAQDMKFTSMIAKELGDCSRADDWDGRSRRISAKIHSYLWNEDDGFYYDKDIQGRFSDVKAVSGFTPLLLEDIPEAHTDALIKLLLDPNHFFTRFPVPSVSVSHAAWSTDMWRGATWINYNYFIIQGLFRQQRSKEAERLIETTIAYVQKYYELYGVTFEFYDAKDDRHPIDCDRKGSHVSPYNIRVKMDSIRDYHWTASLTACLLVQ